jgi:hypothetical protein
MLDVEALLKIGERLDASPAEMERLASQWVLVRARSGRMVPLRANAAQRMFEARRGNRNVILKARQMGMTTWVVARFFLRTITRGGMQTMLVAQHRSAAEGMFRIVHRMWDGLPQDLREGPLRRSRANVGLMTFPELDSALWVGSASDASVGRGVSLTNLHCSEVSRWPGDAAATLAGLKAALEPGGEMVLESTPNGAYGAFYEEWLGAGEHGGNVDASGMVRHFLPWWMEEQYAGPRVEREAMRDDELALAERHGLSGAQIGFRRGLERSFGALRSQEFAEDAESCFRATGACCFDVDGLETRARELADARGRRRNGALLIFLAPQAGREYLVAVDSAGGGADGDFAAAQVIEVATGL